MYVEGKIVKVVSTTAPKKVFDEKELCYKTVMVPAKKVYIKQFMTGYFYWGYSWDCKVHKQYPGVVKIEGNDCFHLTYLRKENENIKRNNR